jgi:hypothetical protein
MAAGCVLRLQACKWRWSTSRVKSYSKTTQRIRATRRPKRKPPKHTRVFSQNFPRLASAMPQAEGEAVMDDAAAAA